MANGQNEDEVRMTLRISRDSGRTWGPTTRVRMSRARPASVSRERYPPCQCQGCRARQPQAAHGPVT
ncbi:hypothetical protein C0Q98_16430 [Streptomyces albidoflavus]|nr:hypothetical protein C0Q98_16430 [Streptomyces albidoflavus]